MTFLEHRDVDKVPLALLEVRVVHRNSANDSGPLIFDQLDHFLIVGKLIFA